MLIDHSTSLDAILSTKPELLIFNPGWNSFPRDFIFGKKELGFPTAALLDHWIDYDKRLHENDADYFIVCDKLAFDAAFAASLSPVLKLNNYHFKELENFDLKSENGTPDGKDLLFVSQTISLHDEIKPDIDPGFTYLGLEEGKVIKNLLENFDQIAAEFQVTGIRFRLHPSETKFRHHELTNRFPSVPMKSHRQKVSLNQSRMPKLSWGSTAWPYTKCTWKIFALGPPLALRSPSPKSKSWIEPLMPKRQMSSKSTQSISSTTRSKISCPS